MAFSNNKEDGGLDFFDLDEDLTADLEDEDGGSIDTGWDEEEKSGRSSYGRREYTNSQRRGESYRERRTPEGRASLGSSSRNGGRGSNRNSRRNADYSSRNDGRNTGYSSRNGGRNTGYSSRSNRQSTGRNSGRSRKRRKRINPVVPVVLLIFFILVIALGAKMYQDRYGYSSTVADLNSYFGISGDSETAIIENNEILDTKAQVFDGEAYLDLDTVQESINPRFYWGITDNIVIYCLPTEMVTTTVGTNEWTSDTDGTVTENYTLTRLSDDGKTLYIALDYIRKFTNLSYNYYSDPNRMTLAVSWGDRSVAELTKDSNVRITGGVKSDILTPVDKGTQVTVLEQGEQWSKVETDDGFIGYLENKVLSDPQTVTDTPVTNVAEPEFTTVRLDGTVNMAWHNLTNSDANANFDSDTADVKALNVIAPTWFSVQDDDGNLGNWASSDYVAKAHDKGWKVWAVVDNFNTAGVDHNNCIALLSRRQNIITQLMNFADQYGFDGINVDFEQIDPAYGQDFIEFIRELSISCRKKGLTLSVDNYVTYNFNDYYHMDEQGVFADYVCIMGYDEHYAGDTEAGSVASIDYVKYGIERALQEVPAEKVVNGIPFYTRLWTSDDTGMTSSTLGMAAAQQFVSDHGQTPVWDETTQQHVVDFTEGSTHYQMWLEDADSIRSKLGVMQTEGIAGVAEWKLTQETSDVWDVIAEYVNGTLNAGQNE